MGAFVRARKPAAKERMSLARHPCRPASVRPPAGGHTRRTRSAGSGPVFPLPVWGMAPALLVADSEGRSCGGGLGVIRSLRAPSLRGGQSGVAWQRPGPSLVDRLVSEAQRQRFTTSTC